MYAVTSSTRLSLSATADLFREKLDKKMAMKEREIDVRKMEVELAKKKWEFEVEERRMRMQLEAEEKKALIELLRSKLD